MPEAQIEYSYETISAPTSSDEEHTSAEYSYETISAPTTLDEESEYSSEIISAHTMLDEEQTKTGYSSHSLLTIESTSNCLYRIPVRPPCKRIKRSDDQLDEVTSKFSFSVNQSAQSAYLDRRFRDLGSNALIDKSEIGGSGYGETGSTIFLKLFGCMITVRQPHIRRDSSYSEASTFAAHNVAPSTSVSDIEWMTIKVSFEDCIILFELELSAGKADLVENVSMRLRKLKNKSFCIKYLDDSREETLLATDRELQDCMVRTRARGDNRLRLLIQLEKDGELWGFMDQSWVSLSD